MLCQRVLLLLKADRVDTATLALQAIPSEQQRSAIVSAALQHRDGEIRSAAAKLVSDQPTAASFSALIKALDDAIPTVRRYGARALGKLHDPRAAKPLFGLLHDDNWYVRAEAAAAFGKLGEPRAAGWLIPLLTDVDGIVRYNVARALREVACKENRSTLVEGLQRAKTAPQQFALAAALAKLGDPLALGPLTNAVTDPDAQVRRNAVQALAESGLPEATNALVQCLSDTDQDVRSLAEAALRQIQKADKTRFAGGAS
jgi:HEAT repeat protein